MKGLHSNGFLPIIAQAIAKMEETHGEFRYTDEINLAELSHLTGLSRAKLRLLRVNGFCETPHGLRGQQQEQILDGWSFAFILSGQSTYHIFRLNPSE